MKSTKAKQLLLNTCLKVQKNLDVSWLGSIKIGANGSVRTYGLYLGYDPANNNTLANIKDQASVLNLAHKRKKKKPETYTCKCGQQISLKSVGCIYCKN